MHRSINKLRSLGLITVEHRGNKSTFYSWNLPEEEVEVEQEEEPSHKEDNTGDERRPEREPEAVEEADKEDGGEKLDDATFKTLKALIEEEMMRKLSSKGIINLGEAAKLLDQYEIDAEDYFIAVHNILVDTENKSKDGNFEIHPTSYVTDYFRGQALKQLIDEKREKEEKDTEEYYTWALNQIRNIKEYTDNKELIDMVEREGYCAITTSDLAKFLRSYPSLLKQILSQHWPLLVRLAENDELKSLSSLILYVDKQ